MTSSHPAQRRLWLLALAGVLLAVAAVYAPTADDYFGGDDFMVLGPVRAMGSWELIEKSFRGHDSIPYWRPLVSPLYAAEVHTFGLRPWPYHLVVIALHLLNVTLLALVALALTGRRSLALAAALLFGVHSAHALTVSMVSSTVELFAMAWYLTTVLCCLRHVRGAGRRWYWAGLGAFVLGLLSKESVAAAAGVITVLFFLLGLIADWRAGAPRWRTLARFMLRILPFWALVLPYTAFAFLTTTEDPSGLVRVMYSPGPHIARNLWWFLARLAAPLDVARGPDVTATGHAGAAVILAAAAYILLRGTNQARFLVLWTAIALTPLALWRQDYLVGRFTYMASAPFAILLALAGAWLADRLSSFLLIPQARRTPAVAMLVLAALGFAMLTAEQNHNRGREGDAYRILVSTLHDQYPDLPTGSEVTLVDGVWPGPFHAVFLNSVADTLYGPGRVHIRNVERGDTRLSVVIPTAEAVRLHYDDGELHEDDFGSKGAN